MATHPDMHVCNTTRPSQIETARSVTLRLLLSSFHQQTDVGVNTAQTTRLNNAQLEDLKKPSVAVSETHKIGRSTDLKLGKVRSRTDG